MAGDVPSDERLRAVLESGGQVVGAVAGVAASVVGGSVVGAAAGTAIGESLSRVGVEVAERLQRRRAARVGGALSAAVVQADERTRAGDGLRRDGLFDRSDGWSDADALLEGVLLAAADSWEEKKVEPLGRLYANIGFDESVAAPRASFLVRVAERLSYRQLGLLEFVRRADAGGAYEHAVVRLSAAVSEAGERPPADPTLSLELDDLSAAQLVGVRQSSGEVAHPLGTWGGGTWAPSGLVTAALTPLGQDLHQLMGLSRLPEADVEGVLRGFGGSLG